MSQLVLLDNEAVQALRDPAHPKHRKVVSYAQIVAHRKRRATEIELAVPTTVRVEAGWDRTSPSWAFANRLRIADISLDTARANLGAEIVRMTRVSVPGAHLGAVIRSSPVDRITVVSSDPGDMRLVTGEASVTIVAT